MNIMTSEDRVGLMNTVITHLEGAINNAISEQVLPQEQASLRNLNENNALQGRTSSTERGERKSEKAYEQGLE